MVCEAVSSVKSFFQRAFNRLNLCNRHISASTPLNFLYILLVDAARRIDTLCNLIDIDYDFLYLRCHGFYVGVVYLNDIPVDCHFPQVGFHVPGRDELHFLFNQRPFFLCYSEFDLYRPFPAVHRLTLLSVLRVWDTSQQAIFNRRTQRRRAKIRKGYPFLCLLRNFLPLSLLHGKSDFAKAGIG